MTTTKKSGSDISTAGQPFIEKIRIQNFKCYHDEIITLKPGINIIVGDNDSGKSTLLEAVYLALTGFYRGKPLRNTLSRHLFNADVLASFEQELSSGQPPVFPEVLIEVFFSKGFFPDSRGAHNSLDEDASGIKYKICFDSRYADAFAKYISQKRTEQSISFPVEFFKSIWEDFALNPVSPYNHPIKTAMIDSVSFGSFSGKDPYVSTLLHADLTPEEKTNLFQAFRIARDAFREADAIQRLNDRLETNNLAMRTTPKIGVDHPKADEWENVLTAFVDEIPFSHLGRGQQCIAKTNAVFGRAIEKEMRVILVEEPENHLSHVNLNHLLSLLNDQGAGRQILVTSHSSYVCNKLDIGNAIIVARGKTANFLNKLDPSTRDYFMKLAGYDTLRVVLASKAVLVEGPSDELIFQRAYMQACGTGHLPIEDGIDVISVGLSAPRFLEIAKFVKTPVAVLTDNDKNYDENVKKRYAEFLDSPDGHIQIYASHNNADWTLEYQFARCYEQDLAQLAELVRYPAGKTLSFEDIVTFMSNHKTDWALRVFSAPGILLFPDYITQAVKWCLGE